MASGSRHPLARLSMQINALQEGFELLCRTGTLKDLARQFFHILRGNLLTVDAHMFFLAQGTDRWEKIYGKGTIGMEHLPDIRMTGVPVIDHLRKRGDLKLLAVQPLIDGAYAALLLDRKLDRKPYTDLDLIALRVFLQLFATSYQGLLHQRKEKELVFSLNHRLLQLTSLIDTGIELSKVRTESSLHGLALERAAALTNASRGSVTVTRQRKTVERIVFPADAVMRRVDAARRMRSKFTFSGATYTFELFDKESRAGAVPFDETDQLLLDALGRQVQASLENQYLQHQEIERQKIERDIAVAAAIQQRILPKQLPDIAGYDVSGVNIMTRFVGGDYYDCIPLRDGRVALVLADVAGKGVPASLLVSTFHAYLTAYLENAYPLLELTKKLNEVMYRASTEERYITAFLGLLTPATGEMESVNAGHTSTYLVRGNGGIEELTNGGLALGMMDMEFPYTTDTVVLGKGDRLLLYSDGVTEAMNAAGALYDTNGELKAFAEQTRTETAQEFIRSLLEDVKSFTGEAPQNDDITALYLLRS